MLLLIPLGVVWEVVKAQKRHRSIPPFPLSDLEAMVMQVEHVLSNLAFGLGKLYIQFVRLRPPIVGWSRG